MDYKKFISFRGLALLMLAAIGLILFIAMPCEDASIGTFVLVIATTKAGAFLAFLAFAHIIRRMEQDGLIKIEE